MQLLKIDKFCADCFFIGHMWAGDRICPNLKSDLAAKDHFTMCSINLCCLLPRSLTYYAQVVTKENISFGHFCVFKISGNKFTQRLIVGKKRDTWIPDPGPFFDQNWEIFCKIRKCLVEMFFYSENTKLFSLCLGTLRIVLLAF